MAPELESIYQSAITAFQQERYNDAIARLSQSEILASAETHALFLDLKAQCYLKLDNHLDAIICFEQALRLDPNCVSALHNYGIFNLEEAEARGIFKASISYNNAYRYLYLALSLSPSNPFILHSFASYYEFSALKMMDFSPQFLLGLCRHAISYYMQAMEYADKIFKVTVRQNFGNFYAKIAKLYYLNEDWDTAAKYYQLAVDIDPLNDVAQNQLGMCDCKRSHYETAIAKFQVLLRITELSEDHSDAWLNIAYCHRHLNQYWHAKRALLQAIRLNSEDEGEYIANEREALESMMQDLTYSAKGPHRYSILATAKPVPSREVTTYGLSP